MRLLLFVSVLGESWKFIFSKRDQHFSQRCSTICYTFTTKLLQLGQYWVKSPISKTWHSNFHLRQVHLMEKKYVSCGTYVQKQDDSVRWCLTYHRNFQPSMNVSVYFHFFSFSWCLRNYVSVFKGIDQTNYLRTPFKCSCSSCSSNFKVYRLMCRPR